MRTIALLLAATSLACAPCAGLADAFDSILNENGAFWSQSPQAFANAWKGKGFRWTSARNETARAYKTAHTFMGLPVVEVLVRFADNSPTAADIVLYNRGDSGDVSETDFRKKLQTIEKKLGEWAGSRRRTVPSRSTAGGINHRKYVWTRKPHGGRPSSLCVP